MKKMIGVLMGMLVMVACQENEKAKDEFTGNQAIYPLIAGSQYNINGDVTFQERNDGSTLITVALSGTEGDIEHPVHLHLGDLTAPGADVYALLNPVIGKTGKSETILSQSSAETPITYAQLLKLSACMKIHLAASGPDRDIILAAGNIGAASDDDSSTGRLGVSVCTAGDF